MRDARIDLDAHAPRPIARRLRQLVRELDDLRHALSDAEDIADEAPIASDLSRIRSRAGSSPRCAADS